MAIHYTDTIYQGINHHGMQAGFVYDNIGMIYVKNIDASGIDIRVLPKQEQDYFYDLLRGDSLGSGTSFPGTKKYGDRFYRTDESIYYKWDGYDWCKFTELCYLMLDYFPIKVKYRRKGARVYRTDENKEYRHNGSTWVEITATSGDTKKRIQSKDNMTVITYDDESGAFYYRINETDILDSEHWCVIPLAKFLGTGDSSAGLQVYWGKGMYPQRFELDASILYPSWWVIDSIDFTLQSQETVKPISDIIDAAMTNDVDDIWYYDVAAFVGGLYYREFTVNYHYDDPPIYDSYVDDLIGVIGRLLCDEYDQYYHTDAYTSFKYVNGSTGSDSDTGGISDPWKTIAHAASTVTAGALVRIAAGTYYETSDIIPVAGTNLKPIHFHADGQVTVQYRSFDIDTISNIIIDGFRLEGTVNGIPNEIRIKDSSRIIVLNCEFTDLGLPFDDGFLISNSEDVYIIANKIMNSGTEGQSYGIYASSTPSNTTVVILFNTITSPYPWIKDTGTTVYTYDSVNEVGNYLLAAESISDNGDCIGTSSYTYDGISDIKPIVKRGASFHKALAINWLNEHLKYSIFDIINNMFSPNLRHVRPVSVPAAGATVPHSFVKVIDANSKERLVAYSNKTEGTDYGACEIGENGEIINGMDNVKIQSVNGANYSINPISRILDRNSNGDIIIEGRSIIHE